MELPAELTFGTVVGTFATVAAGVETPAEGAVVLTPLATVIPMPAETPPRTIITKKTRCDIVAGILVGPDDAPGVDLAAGIQWEAKFRIDNGDDPEELTFYVETGETVDLADLVTASAEQPVLERVVNAAGIVTQAQLQTEAAARAAADAAFDVALDAEAAARSEADAGKADLVTGKVPQAQLPAHLDPTALNGAYVAGQVRAAGGVTTPGKVVEIGTTGSMPADIGTSGVIGEGAPNYENVIGGVIANVNTAASNIPPGGAGTGVGALVAPNGNWNWIWGGYDNVVNGWACQVRGYHHKVNTDANHVTLGGGSLHIIDAGLAYPTIGGGTQNRCSANYATIAGGAEHLASGLYSVIGGGYSHSATQRSATVAGGEQNDATNTYTTIGGGLSNAASANAATVAGGQSNTASGVHSLVAGRDNTAAEEATVATGRGAIASVPGERAHSSSVFAAQGDAQHRQFIVRKQTTDATPTALFANAAGSSPMLVPADTTWAFSALVSARRTDADNESAGYKIEGVVDRNATASTIALVGTPTVTVLGEDNAAWDCTVGVNTSNGSLVITVTGQAAKTVRWVAVVDVAQVSG